MSTLTLDFYGGNMELILDGKQFIQRPKLSKNMLFGAHADIYIYIYIYNV